MFKRRNFLKDSALAAGFFGLGNYLPFFIATFVLLCAAAVAGAALYSEDEADEAA